MKTLEINSPIEIKRFIEGLSENGRAPLSAYWEIWRLKGVYLDDLRFPVSRSVSGEVEKRAKRLKETGRVHRLSNGRKSAWMSLNTVAVRSLRKLGLITLEKQGGRIFVTPIVRSIVLKTGEGREVEKINDIISVHELVRGLRGGSKTRRSFDIRLRYRVPDAVEIVFPTEGQVEARITL